MKTTVIAFLRETPCADRIRRGEYEGGLYNGYVAFPNDAIKWCWPEDDYGWGYSFYEVVDMYFNVHGGITFASTSFNPYGCPMIPLTAIPDPESMRDWTIIGWDTLHLGDTKEMWTLEETKKETLDLMNQVIDLIEKQNNPKQ